MQLIDPVAAKDLRAFATGCILHPARERPQNRVPEGRGSKSKRYQPVAAS